MLYSVNDAALSMMQHCDEQHTEIVRSENLDFSILPLKQLEHTIAAMDDFKELR